MNYEKLQIIVWLVFFGICFASFYAYYKRCLVGNILRALIKCEASDEESAKTLSEIGYAKGLKRSFAKFALRKNSALRKTVTAVYEEKEPEKKHRDQLFLKPQPLSNEQKYYVPEEKRIVSEIRYENKGTSLKTFIVSIVTFFILAVLILTFLPWLMEKLNGMLPGSTPSDDSGYSRAEDTVDNLSDETQK